MNKPTVSILGSDRLSSKVARDTTCANLAHTKEYVILTLMIAESRTEEKYTIVKVIVNLINKNN